MPRKARRSAPGSARRRESPLGTPEVPPRGDPERDSRSSPGRRSESHPVHDGGITRRRGAGTGPVRTPSAFPEPIENDTDSPDADLWR